MYSKNDVVILEVLTQKMNLNELVNRVTIKNYFNSLKSEGIIISWKSDGNHHEIPRSSRECWSESFLLRSQQVRVFIEQKRDKIMTLTESARREALEIISLVKNKVGQARTDALKKFWDLAYKNENRNGLMDPNLHFVSTMVESLESAISEPVSLEKCTGGFWCLSADLSCRKSLGSSETRLIPTLLKIKNVNSTVKTHCKNILMNLSLDRSTHAYLLTPTFGYMKFLADELRDSPTEAITYNCFQCLFTDNEAFVVDQAIEYGIPRAVMKEFKKADIKAGSWGEIPKRCLNILMYLSRYSEGALTIRDLDESNFLYELSKDTGPQGLKACLLIANVYGREESNLRSKSLLEDRAYVLPLINKCFNAIINYDPENAEIKEFTKAGFIIGVIPLNIVASALKSLSLSEKNKTILLHDERLLVNVLICIQAFINNAAQFGGVYDNMFRPSGGGGEDYFSLENFIEFLLQLSFAYENEEMLLTNFNKFGSYKIFTLCENLLNLAPNRHLSYETKNSISQLHARYLPKKKEIPLPPASVIAPSSDTCSTSSATNTDTPKHIMISYAWGANKHLVIALADKLRSLGYDIWRDEEGSEILNGLHGDIVERMAEAIQHAHTMIICVSPQYKDSANCRAEAQYARSRAALNGLKLIYVMMDRNYHTNSVPRVVDGWLGFLIGAELWYPLWEPSQVDSTSLSIKKLVGDNASLAKNRLYMSARRGGAALPSAPSAPSTSSPTDPTTPISSASFKAATTISSPKPPAPPVAAVKSYATAWSLLDSKKAKYSSVLQGLLEDMGLESSEDLSHLDSSEWRLLSLTLKKPQQSAFLDALSIEIPYYEINSRLADVSLAWQLITSQPGLYNNALQGAIEDLGVEKAEDLRALDGNDMVLIASTLKKPQQKKFITALRMTGI